MYQLFITWVTIGSLAWIGLWLTPWRPWSSREQLDTRGEQIDLSDVTVLIPARNEADVIGSTIESLGRQGSQLRVVLVNDQSDDGTAEVALAAARHSSLQLLVLNGEPLPDGWAGKLWALQQGLQKVETPYVLLMDADITLSPGLISSLRNFIPRYDFVSLMAHLKMETFWEKLLIPSFIYFFKLLYPFALGNNPKSKVAVAAGGFIFTKTSVLQTVGAFESLRGALIDDCTLAAHVKRAGFRTWMGLTHSVQSHRSYETLESIWNMVARSAYTQLRYRASLLAACTIAMLTVFLAPLLGLLFLSHWWEALALLGVVAMVTAYLPTLLYYRLSPFYALALPVVGGLYLAMTWTSAIRYYRGQKSQWKGRTYLSENGYQKHVKRS